jgi:phosphoribosylglycinamide formyltransferase-1
MVNVGILASGRGSNFEAILQHQKLGVFNGVNLSVLIYNNPQARVKDLAAESGIASHFVDHSGKDRTDFEHEIATILDSHNVQLVCLAGWDRVVGSELFQKYRWRMMNIHPALLPSFGWKGLNARYVHEAALEYGVKLTGCTVFFVDVSVEKGPVILQHPVRVLESEREMFATRREEAIQSLSDRVLLHEHRMYPKAIQLYAEDRLRVEETTTHDEHDIRTIRSVATDLSDDWEKKWIEKQRPFIEWQRKEWTDRGKIVNEE